LWHTTCVRAGVVGSTNDPTGWKHPIVQTLSEDQNMKWTKPEAEVVAVTMEVTAYVATL
jgi:coenzyme PQQ precursor peptide PqqA